MSNLKAMTEPMQRQPPWAPVAASGGIVAGISAGLIGAYLIGDCIAFKTKRGECDSIIVAGVPAVVAGIGSICGAVGGFWMYNRKLARPLVDDEGGGTSLPAGPY